MKRLKALIVRLSDSLLNNIALGLPRSGVRSRRKAPPLKLVSHNPHPVVESSQVLGRAEPTVAGHAEAIEDALHRGAAWFLAHQDSENGYWVHELEADTTLTSEYIMLRRFLNQVDLDRERKAVRYLLHTQLPEGGWSIYAGGPADVSASVKAYFALKLAGVSADEPAMQLAREAILRQGGVVSANVFTKIMLALFGQYDWRGIPSMPPELVLAPRWLYFNLYAVSYWSRAVIIPLLIIFAYRPLCPIAREQGVEELFVVPPERVDYRTSPPFQRDAAWFSWRNFFVWVDGLLKLYECYPLVELRRRALKRAEQWMLEHMQGEGGLGAIYPAMANSVMALQVLGYSPDHPVRAKALSEIEALEVHTAAPDGNPSPPMMHVQPCFSPVWDTALTINMLIERGLPLDHPALLRAASWLRARQCARIGDWIVSAPQAKPGGWYFQFENEWYPDVDDTAAVVIALAKLHAMPPAEQDDAIRRGYEWVLALQSSDGGWGAYDKDNNRLIFNKIPFADHQALLDPSTADLTGRCLEMLGTLGYDRTHPAVQPALEFLRREQEPNGSWYGRWGVNYIYGTWCVLSGLRAIGMDMSAPWIQRAVTWLESVQNQDGGWGESCLSYEDPAWAGRGESTPSQTAWAVMGLLAAGVSDSINVLRGVHYLLKHQREDGVWDEPLHTGTGFPRVFYLRYHGYSKYFPLWALAMYRNVKMQGQSRADELRKAAQAVRRRSFS
ncbi:MAG: squalene--hopene cyclase [Nitrospirae bacterium]|nr:MAG: squalene--hopene cyclase [Nitrospirota bacterium]